MYGYIYITTNKVNNKKYIGQKRGEFNPNYKGSGKRLKIALKKYGVDNFSVDIIEIVNSELLLEQREIYWIKFYNAVKDDNFYNIGIGGKCWNRGLPNPIAKNRMLTNNPMKNPEIVKKSSKSKKGKQAHNKITKTYISHCKWCNKQNERRDTIKNRKKEFCGKSCAASYSNTHRYT